jgi:hypothetical protein
LLLAIVHHNQGSKSGILATIKKPTGIARTAKTLLAIRKCRCHNAIPAAIDNPKTELAIVTSSNACDSSKALVRLHQATKIERAVARREHRTKRSGYPDSAHCPAIRWLRPGRHIGINVAHWRESKDAILQLLSLSKPCRTASAMENFAKTPVAIHYPRNRISPEIAAQLAGRYSNEDAPAIQ